MQFKVGDKVRVKAEVKAPRCSWGMTSPGDVGIVTETDCAGEGRGILRIDFPKHPCWCGVSDEMELAEPKTKPEPSVLPYYSTITGNLEDCKES